MTTPTVTDTSAKSSGFLASLLTLVPKSLTLTGNPAVDGAIFKGIVGTAGIVGGWIYAQLKLTNPAYATYLTGAIVAALVMAASFIWGWLNTKLLQAKSMNAAMALKASGASILLPDPKKPGNVVDKPITPASAQAIVNAFGNVKVSVDAETALTNKLNTFSKSGGAVSS